MPAQHTRGTRKSTLVFAMLLVAWAGAALAQEGQDLPRAVEKALRENPEVQVKLHQWLAAGHEQAASRGAWRPSLDLEASTGDYTTASPALAHATGYGSTTTAVRLRQVLFDGFATRSDVQRLGHLHRAAYYDLLAASNDVGLEAVRAYLDVQRYRALLDLARDNHAQHADIYARLESRVQAGVGRRVDLEQAAGRLALAQSNSLTEASNLHDVSARYQRIVGELPATRLADAPSFAGLLATGDAAGSDAVLTHPAFMSAVATLRAFRAETELRQAARYPTLEFRASHTMETNRSGLPGDYQDTAAQLVLRYNLYNGGSDAARVRQFAEKLRMGYALRDKVCRDQWQTLAIALHDVGKLASQLTLLNQHELSTSKARQAYRQQFDIGQRSLLDLLDTENETFQARRALANAEFDRALAQARVLAASGQLLRALGVTGVLPAPPAEHDASNDPDDATVHCTTEVVPSMGWDATPQAQATDTPVSHAAQP